MGRGVWVKVIRLDAEARDAFLADPRLGILILPRPSGAPAGVPVWYAWDGEQVTMVTKRDSAKVRWLEQDPRVSVLVTNIAPERARWVSLEGRVRIHAEHGQEEAERLARRYLPRDWNGEIEASFAAFRRLDLVQIALEPDRIRSYAEID